MANLLIRPVRQIRATEKTEASDVASHLNDVLTNTLIPMTQSPLVTPTLLTSITLVSGTVNNIPHTLPMEPAGWFVVNHTTNANVWATSGSFPGSFLYLNASANCIVNLMVF